MRFHIHISWVCFSIYLDSGLFFLYLSHPFSTSRSMSNIVTHVSGLFVTYVLGSYRDVHTLGRRFWGKAIRLAAFSIRSSSKPEALPTILGAFMSDPIG